MGEKRGDVELVVGDSEQTWGNDVGRGGAELMAEDKPAEAAVMA